MSEVNVDLKGDGTETSPVKSDLEITETKVPDSSFMGVSIRAWIALILTSTVCFMNLISIFKGVGFVLEIKEPLYSGWLLSLGFYFGQKNK